MHGFTFPIRTPQCFSGSYSRSLTGNTLRFRLLLLPLPDNDVDVDVDIFDKLLGELLFDDELLRALALSEMISIEDDGFFSVS